MFNTKPPLTPHDKYQLALDKLAFQGASLTCDMYPKDCVAIVEVMRQGVWLDRAETVEVLALIGERRPDLADKLRNRLSLCR